VGTDECAVRALLQRISLQDTECHLDGKPELACGGEVAPDQIGVPWRPRYRPRGTDPFGAPCPFDAGDPHQPGDLIAADVVSSPAGCLP
jgi:hypothetical protein